jgi:stearoyl-CoA desaturase (delta-9 desaturase)
VIGVHLGVLVGLAGPLGMMHTHDLRDWAQRQGRCHDYFAHRQSMFKDAWWQMHCDVILQHPPEFVPEVSVANNRIYQWMQQTWMLQQLPWALLLFYFGGIAWVVWGIFVRLAVSITGHWLIGYFAHNNGGRSWHVNGAGVQGYNIRFASLLTMGESWHNNHHAFPGSALLGIYDHQPDPGWWVLMVLQKMGLVWGIVGPNDLAERPELQVLAADRKVHKSACSQSWGCQS